MAEIKPQQEIQQATASSEGERGGQQRCVEIVANKKRHDAHCDRIAGQKDKLHKPVPLSIGQIPVTRNIQIMAAVRTGPELQGLDEVLLVSHQMPHEIYKQQYADIDKQQRDKYFRADTTHFQSVLFMRSIL